jgi:hypothetical protein
MHTAVHTVWKTKKKQITYKKSKCKNSKELKLDQSEDYAATYVGKRYMFQSCIDLDK